MQNLAVPISATVPAGYICEMDDDEVSPIFSGFQRNNRQWRA